MLRYRLATTDDLDQLIELRALMQAEVNSIEPTPAYRETVRRYFSQAMRDGSYVSSVAEMEGQLVSANGLAVYRKPPSVNGGTGLVGYVTNVYTRPDWRGRGIASELMKILIEHARARRVEKLHLGATDSGKGVYERVGFRPPRHVSLELKL